MRNQTNRSATITALLAGAALLPTSAAAQDVSEAREVAVDERTVVAMGGGLTPLSGSLSGTAGGVDPLKGRIRAFEGDLGPFIGRIRAFEGDLTAMKGRIRAFEGDIDPFKGRIRAFWGDLTPALGDIDPAIGRIRAFSDSYLPQASGTLKLWDAGDLTSVAARLGAIKAATSAEWGAQVLLQTGKTFDVGFADPFFAKWGVDLGNPQSLAGWDVIKRQQFMLAWYDNALNFSGMDRADHWMNAIGWTPKLTQTQGGGSQAVIGLIDFFVANDDDIQSKVVYSGGYKAVDNAHGAAVGSLIVASHDGRGIMGIAPKAKVAAYNPFDSSMTASWEDVKTGITAVGQKGASVINLSLGVPGHTLAPEWRDVFKTSAIDKFKDSALYVIAAGNDGIVQKTNIDMKDAFDSTFIIVGSVDPNGNISAFSNQPGTSCLTEGTECKNTAVWNGTGKFEKPDYLKESGLLMNRFLVAPGEMILVSDGNGGVTRMSGTSFAAPLVAGAIALIHDRWPWLKKHPRDVAKIILESAQDLGAPGVDPVYGHGLLDIEAAQSALNFDQLKYYVVDGTKQAEVKVSTLQSSGIQSAWTSKDMYISAFEKLDGAERDFLIPLSDRLFNTSVGGRSFQEFMYNRFNAWLGGASFAMRGAGFSDLAVGGGELPTSGWRMQMRGRMQMVPTRNGNSRLTLQSSVSFDAPSGSFGVAFGSGEGAAALAGSRNLGMSSDYDPTTGGANPLLGFASGGMHVATRVRLSPNLDVSVGTSQQERGIAQDLEGDLVNGADRALLATLGDYRAMAATVRFDYLPASNLTVSAAITRLQEDGAMLGVRSLERADLAGITASDGVTVGADWSLGDGVSLFGSATVTRTSTARGALLRVDGATGTAFQAGIAKDGVLGGDRMRLTLAQPLATERGYVDVTTVAVVDRETGEKGLVTERFSIDGGNQRRHVAEMLYGAAVGERTEVNLFGRGELRPVDVNLPRWTVGGSLRTLF